MKLRFVVIAVVCSLCSYAFAGNYTLTIDGKEYDFDKNKQQLVRLPDGRSLQVTLNEKDVVTFKAENFSFDHSSRFSPSRTDLGHGIHQTIMTSPRGTLVILQEYSSFDPSALVDTMVNELTKEEVQYGYKLNKSEAENSLSDGTKLTGKKVISAFKDTEYTRHVLVGKGKNSAVMIVVQIEKDAYLEEKQIIDLFWKTLKVSLN